MTDPATSRWQHYTRAAHRPLTCLLFLCPFLATYEIGVWWLSRSGEMSRNVGDVLLLWFFHACGWTGLYLPGVLLVGMLLCLQVHHRYPWRVSPSVLVGMAVECCILSVALLAMFEMSSWAMEGLDHSLPFAAGWSGRALFERVVFFAGAGVFEEFVFRWILISFLVFAFRLAKLTDSLSRTSALILAAIAFSLVHHWGSQAETFTWFAFGYRTLAGLFFGVVFLTRGFAIAAGTHAIYDILVGVLLP